MDEAHEFLEVVAGERCPCGHLVENHAEAQPLDIVGVVAKFGTCKICPPRDPCKGMIEFEDFE